MGTEKVSLTLDERALREARSRVGRRGLSSYVDDALRQRLQRDRLIALLAELEAEHGPIPDDIQEQVDREWREASKQRRKSRTR